MACYVGEGRVLGGTALLLLLLAGLVHHYNPALLFTFLQHASFLAGKPITSTFLEQSSSSNTTIAQHLHHLTLHPHTAGSFHNLNSALYVHNCFSSYGLQASFRDFHVLLSLPSSRFLSVSLPDGTIIHASLQEAQFPQDPYSSHPDIVPTFHAYSPSASVISQAVYVNYGRSEDYQTLRELGISIEGAIVVARYGKIYRGDIVALAAKEGAAAALIYSDPMDYAANSSDGFYPDSQWLPPSGVQRGTVFQELGDPLTPGWPSTSYAERLPIQDPATRLPSIPSLPISAQDALPILKSLEGPVAPLSWHGALELPAYRVGRGPSTVNFSYEGNQTIGTIRNVFAVMRGSDEPDRYVLLGNHRDAWTFGAVDPNSGTAVLLEVARRFGMLQRLGWRPRRTVYFCNWDAEEYGLIGSTEWVEENIDLLSARAVAYLNVDSAVAGPGFSASATPQLDGLLKKITQMVSDPDEHDATIYDTWVKSGQSSSLIGRLGGTGSDYAPFLQHAGVPAIDLSFGDSYPVYHSTYDNYNWMLKFGDPFFHRHAAMAEVWGLLTLELVDGVILPFDYEVYATQLQVYAETLDGELKAGASFHNVTVEPLYFAISDLLDACHCILHEIKLLTCAGAYQRGSSKGVLQQRSLNDRLLLAERAFLDPGGLPRGAWYKHMVYGPTTNNDYASTSFPSIVDALYAAKIANNAMGWSIVEHEIWRVARAISRAALALRGELT